MAEYYLNTNRQANGDYEVHTSTCRWLPGAANREYLGAHLYCSNAVAAAKVKHPNWHRINGCKYCCAPCHTS